MPKINPTAAAKPVARKMVTILTTGVRSADNWPITWADDDQLYTAYGDGKGFEPYIDVKLSVPVDMTGPVSARIILRDPSVDAAVMETARGGILRSGLGYHSADVSCCLNISADHLGLKGVETLDDLAVAHAVTQAPAGHVEGFAQGVQFDAHLFGTIHSQETGRQVAIKAAKAVGYTNAGKSSLLNALTQADVLAEDKLFATLDPTTRRVQLPGGGVALFTDTVGFIQKLPTNLIAAFRATLEEVLAANLIVHVRDISHPETEEQAQDVRAILAFLGMRDASRKDSPDYGENTLLEYSC
mgnify:CR=1 FL=1